MDSRSPCGTTEFLDPPARKLQIGGAVVRHTDGLFECADGIQRALLPGEELAQE
jgi:hypothetical protein